jgi:glycosyltransferase involved in cell wall biosynthesis
MSGEASVTQRPPTRALVTVIIPTFNRRDYLRIALGSAVAQTYRELEIVVQDNASAVDPVDVVASFGDPRIKYYRNAENIGLAASVISASAKAHGDYVAILGDDDVWHPDFLTTLVPPLDADGSLVLAFCDHDIIDPDGRCDAELTEKVTRRWRRHLLHEGVYRPFDEIALVRRSICVMSAAVLRRADIDWQAVPRELSFSLDLYLAYLAARTGKGCYYSPSRLAHYRYHPNSTASTLRLVDSRIANARDAMRYWDDFLHDDGLGRNKEYYMMKLGFNALVIVTSLGRRGNWREALVQLRRFWRDGFIHPRILLYHLVYALRLQRPRA